MTRADLEAAIGAGRCTWDDVLTTLERARVPASEQIEILAGRAALRLYAALMVGQLARTGESPMAEARVIPVSSATIG